ncbi:MAG TPA: hypothetical protein VFJ90_08780 [Candidatus Didemnitutus sp.]|nr:hypothetical protein [Candidatus Didemnitutus sp.]
MPTTLSKRKNGKSVAKTVLAALTPADITLTVAANGFKDVLMSKSDRGERGTKHTMTMFGLHSRVTLIPAKGTRPSKLIVKKGGAILRFHIKSEDPNQNYFPLGIAFVRRITPATLDCSTDIVGRGNFSFDSIRISDADDTLSVTDSYNDTGPADRYKFSVIIQRERDGQIGVIDPDVDHESQT